MSIRAPVVVRCLSCAAAVDSSVADACPFCGTDVASMPVISPERAEAAPVTAPVLRKTRRPPRWPVLLVLAAATAAAFTGSDLRGARAPEAPARLPSVAIPILSTGPARAPRPVPTAPAATADAEAGTRDVPSRTGCDFFTAQAIEREYTFEHARADLRLQRARENNDHTFRLDHDRKAYDARAKVAADDHAATVAALDGRLSRARAACDPTLVF